MTNKSIGNFLSELRKEKGLTQKEIADYLNVSDKTVSHWECDKYSPDISVIPILAEFFGVTCDEILKGEKATPLNNETVTEATDDEASCDENNNEIKFSYEPLDKKSEYEKYAKIRLQNAYNKLKLNSIIAVFTSFVLQAIFYVIIEIIDQHIGLWDFNLYAVNISAIFSVTLGAIILFSSYLKFTNTLNLCNLQKVEYKKWKKKALSIYILIPIILFALVCINSIIQLMPVNHTYIESGTMEVPSTTSITDASETYLETTLPNSVDASENYTDGDLIMPVPTSMTSDSGETQYADTSEEVNILTD